jgi:hypothetical protein
VLQFTDGQTAKISALVPGAAEGTFTLNGNTLIGNFAGEQVTLTRK